MNRVLGILLLVSASLPVGAQRVLSLDSCRALALRNNKQLGVSKLKQEVASNVRKSARTKYLPHVSALGTYQYTSEEISLLSDDQKSSLQNLGTNTVTAIQGSMANVAPSLSQLSGILSTLGIPAGTFQQLGTGVAGMLNSEGQKIVDAFHTDTRNLWAGAVVVTQPVFMGGAIVAMNKLADLGEQMAANSTEASRQTVLYATDQAYWQVVSLNHKKRLAESYLNLVKKLDGDVQKMIEEGVATRSEGLSVSVKVSEAEMAVQKVNDGLALSKMLLCQMMGLPIKEDITLADEENLTSGLSPWRGSSFEARPELKMLDTGVEMSRQATRIMKAGALPQVALMGGYAVSNPSLVNGFEKKFHGFWNVGVLVRVPIWNWGDVMYKVRASKGATAIVSLERDEAREKIELQVNQSTFKVDEAHKRLTMAEAGIKRADENLRTANLGFQEGVISPTVVMEAQTAWLQAQSQKIDAEIDVRLSQVDLQKALGVLAP
ncbi:MAG: TolC family protein [Prevotella sp.]|nr:TolC family protein [Prevotella sp.]